MTDFAISYASQDAGAALAVLKWLRTKEFTVWIDRDLDAIGLPVGSDRRKAIAEAIRDTAVLIVIDSQDWQVSNNCWEEYTVANTNGTAVAVLPASLVTELGSPDVAPDPGEGQTVPAGRKSLRPAVATVNAEGLDELAEYFVQNSARLHAHVRIAKLASSRDDSTNARSWLPRLRADEANEDAMLLRSAGPRPQDARTTPQIQAWIDRNRAQTRDARRNRLIIGVAALAIVSVLATVAFVAQERSAAEDATAQKAESAEASLLDANLALSTLTTKSALALITKGEKSANTPAIATAKSELDARSREISILQVPAEHYRAMAVSKGGNEVVLATANEIIVANRATGAVSHTFLVKSGTLGETIQLSPDGSQVAFVSATSRNLVEMDLQTGRVRSLNTTPPTAFLVDGAGDIWWSAIDGAVSEIRTDGSSAIRVAATSPAQTVDALQLDDRSQVLYLLTSAGALLSYAAVSTDDSSSSLSLKSTTASFGEGAGLNLQNTTTEQTDFLVQCGTSVTARQGISYSVLATSTGSISRETLFTYKQDRSLACYRNAAITAEEVFPYAETVPDGAPQPSGILSPTEPTGTILFASNRAATSLAVVHSNGELDVISSAAADWQAPVAARSLLPLSQGTLSVEADGTVLGVSGTSIGTLPASNNARATAVGSNVGAIIDGGTVAYFSADHQLGTIDTNAEGLWDPSIDNRGDLVAATLNGYILTSVNSTGVSHASVIPVRSLAAGEYLVSISVSPDGSTVAATTTDGRLIVMSSTGVTQFAKVIVANNGRAGVRFVGDSESGADERLIIATQTGFVRIYDTHLHLLKSSWVGAAVQAISTSANANVALVALADYRAVLVSAHTGLTLQQFDENSTAPLQEPVLAEDGRRVLGLFTVPGSDGGSASVIERTYFVWTN